MSLLSGARRRVDHLFTPRAPTLALSPTVLLLCRREAQDLRRQRSASENGTLPTLSGGAKKHKLVPWTCDSAHHRRIMTFGLSKRNTDRQDLPIAPSYDAPIIIGTCAYVAAARSTAINNSGTIPWRVSSHSGRSRPRRRHRQALYSDAITEANWRGMNWMSASRCMPLGVAIIRSVCVRARGGGLSRQ